MQSTRFREMGYEVISTPQHEEGIEILKKGGIDIILVDPIDTPHNVAEFIDRVKKEIGQLPPLLVLTTQTFLPSVQRIIKTDYTEFILKPIRDAIFKDSVNAALKYTEEKKSKPQSVVVEQSVSKNINTTNPFPPFLLETLKAAAEKSATLAQKINELGTKIQQQQQQIEVLQNYQKQVLIFPKALTKRLKEPTRLIYNALQFLRNDATINKNEPALSLLEPAENGTHQIIQLIYSLSSLANSLKKPTIQIIDCKEIIEKVIQNLQPLIAEFNTQIHFDNLPIINADPQQIEQLFEQLLQNSIQYNQKETPIVSIYGIEKEEDWQFSIEDNGNGIEKQHFDKIFHPLTRFSVLGNPASNGVGLTICENITGNHNGKIWLESEVDIGSTFFFTLKK